MLDVMKGSVEETEMAMEVINTTTLRTIFEVQENSTDVINVKLLEWISQNFNEEGNKIISSDNDVVIGTGSSLITITSMNVKQPAMIYFDYTFDIKEGRIRFTISEPYYYVVYIDSDGHEKTDPTLQYVDEDTLKRISRGIKEKGLIETISNYIGGISNNDSDW